MSPRSLYLATLGLLSAALLFGVIASISLPLLSAIDYTRVTFPNAPKSNDFLKEARFGIWAPCEYDGNNHRSCLLSGTGYSFLIPNSESTQTVEITSSWTRGLAIHPVVTVFTALTLGFAVSRFEHATLGTLVSAGITVFIGFIGFFIDIALFAHAKALAGTLKPSPPDTHLGAAFWLAFVALLLVIAGACTTFLGGRPDGESSSYPDFSNGSGKGGFLGRFRRN